MSSDTDKTLEFQCPKCATKLKATAKAAGKRFNCPKCGSSVKVPGIVAESSSDDDWLKLEDEPASTPPPAAVKSSRTAPSSTTSTAAGKSTTASTAASATSPRTSTPAPASASSPAPAQSSTRSIFDDDLPELAALEPPKPRTSMANLLGVDDIEELVPVKTSAAASKPAKVARPSESEPADKKPQKNKATALDPANAQYRCACPSCGTPQYVTLAKQGKVVRCPDCFLEFKIPPPPPGWKPTQAATKNWGTDLAQLTPAEAQRDAEQRSKQTDDLLKKAAQELDDSDLDKMYDDQDFDTQTFMIRTFGFLRDPASLFQVLTYCVLFGILFAALQYCLNMSVEHRMFLLLAGIAVPLMMIITAFPMFGTAISILEAVANGLPKVRDWHGFNFFDQIGELMLFALAAAASAVPGFLIGGLVAQSVENSILVVLVTMVTSFLFFPIILLSMLDNESAINPFSLDVIRSIRIGTEAWATYYFKSFIAYFCVFIAWTLLLGGSPILAGIGGLLMPLLFFYTIQQLGVLANDISEHLAIIVPPKEEDDEVLEGETRTEL